MSNEIIVLSKEELKVLVKEAIKEALALNAEQVAESTKPVKEVEKKEESKKEVKEVKKAEKAEEEKEDAKDVAEENDSEVAEDIESLSYNDLKKKCKEMGVSAVGNRATLVARLLEHLEGSESEDEAEESNNTKETKKPATSSNKGKKTVHEEEEEDSEDEDESNEAEEFYEELDEAQIKDIVADLGKDDLLAIIEEMGEELPKYNKKKAIDMIVSGGQATVDALVLLGYVDTDEEEDTKVEEGEEEHSLADDLADLDTEELAEICAEYELSVKGKKQALIDRIVKAVEDGIIEEEDLFEDEEDEEESDVIDAEYEDVEEEDAEEEDIEDEADEEEDEEDWYSEEELEEYETEELEEIANENEIEIPKKKVKKGKKTVTTTDRKALIQAILELGDEEDEEDEEDADAEGEYEPKQERLDKEEEIEEEIRAKYKAKKLKDADIKKFLVKYNEGNPNFKMSDLSKKEALEQYIEAKVGLVDDDGYVIDPEECYIRNNEYFCCGKQLSMNKGTYYCEVCGNEFNE